MKSGRLAELLFISIFCVFDMYSQTKAPSQTRPVASKKRSVTINTKDGSLIKGSFVRADADKIEIDTQSGSHLAVPMDDVTTVIFVNGRTPEEPQKVEPYKEAATQALKALRVMSVATEAGISRRDYSNRFVETKTVVEECLNKVPEGGVNDEIKSALDDYETALKIWNNLLALSATETDSHEAERLYDWLYKGDENYNLFIKSHPEMQASRIFRTEAITVIWKSANKHIQTAEYYLSGTK